eukprot:1572072-Pleurochrysis_carterae.AAC.1
MCKKCLLSARLLTNLKTLRNARGQRWLSASMTSLGVTSNFSPSYPISVTRRKLLAAGSTDSAFKATATMD